MTVIGRKQRNCTYPNSNNGSDTESLNIASASTSDAESVSNEGPARTYANLQRKARGEDPASLKRNSGRRKHRRYHNRCSLEILSEEDETEDTFIALMSPYKSPLTRLLEDDEALSYWNEFLEKSEEEQNQILSPFSSGNPTEAEPRALPPFSRISAKIRRTIKIRKNLSTQFVQSREVPLIDFFKTTPKSVFKRNPPNSFERLLFHAIAQYHGLSSISILEDGKRSVEVYNASENWIPAECYLFNFITEQRV